MKTSPKRIRMALAVAALGLAVPAAAQIGYGTDGVKFLIALKEGDNATAVEYVETYGATVVNFRGQDGDAALHIAAKAQSEKWVGYLLSRGGDPNIVGANGDTPLIIAARLGFVRGAERLLRKGAEIDGTNKRGETPLIAAVQQRQTGMVRYLLEKGADPDKADYASGYTARDYAKRDNRIPEMARMMEGVEAGGMKKDD